MKIAIANTDFNGFNQQWIQYCIINNIEFKLVNAYEPDIIDQLKEFNIFLWHFSHGDYRDMIFAKSLLFSLSQRGLKVFPNFNTCWHFDDKIAQKYLIESLNIPFINTWIFYSKEDTMKWIEANTFPKVFKLRCGASSSNVILIKNKKKAKTIANKMFKNGISPFNSIGYLKERFNKYLLGKDSLFGILKGVIRLIIKTKFSKMSNREKGYVYFQEFIPNNGFDIRIIVIGEKAFGIKRLVRKNDFRASGSGMIIYDKDQIDIRCVKIAFDANLKIKSQCIAFDFVFDNNDPKIIEISYGFLQTVYEKCEGYWDYNLHWHSGKIFPQYWQIENLIQ